MARDSELGRQKHGMAVFDEELHGQILGLRITHLAGQTFGAHDRGREDDRDVQARHQILHLPLHHSGEMEDEKLERVSMPGRHDGCVVDGGAHDFDAGGRVRVDGRVEQAVVDFVGDEGCGKAAEVLFERGGDGVDVEIWVGDVEFIAAFEAFSDVLDLRITSGLPVDAFNVHACERSQSVDFVILGRTGNHL